MNGKLMIFLLFAVCGLLFANYATVVFDPMGSPGASYSISGSVLDGSDVGIANANVTVLVTNSSGTVLNGSNMSSGAGAYVIFLTIPADFTHGPYNLSVSTNASTPSNSFMFRVSNVSTANVTILSSPPFTTGSTINLTVNLTNSSSGAVAGVSPRIQIFSAISFSEVSDWSVSNLSPVTDASGLINYTVTVSNSSGPYFLVVEYGAGSSFLNIISDKQLILSVEQDGFAASLFGVAENFTIKARLRSASNGSSFTGQTVSGKIMQESSGATTLLSTFTFTETSNEGLYEYNYTAPSSTGTFTIRAESSVNGDLLRANMPFTVASYSASVASTSEVQDKFVDLSDMGFIGSKPGSNLTLLFKITNMSNNQFVSHSITPADASVVNCSNVSITSLMRVENSTEYLPTILSTINRSNVTSEGTLVCAFTFTVPSSSGSYRLVSQVTYGGSTYSANYFFPIQNYIIKALPVAEGSTSVASFNMISTPATNITLIVTAFNISSDGAELSAGSVSNINVTSILHLPTMTTLLSGQSGFNASAASSGNQVTITLPNGSYTDFMMVRLSATVGGENVTGSAAIISKYLVGNIMPSASGFQGIGGAGGGGPGGPGGIGNPETKCIGGGVVEFRGSVMLASTGAPQANVVVSSTPAFVAEEQTGKFVTSYFNLSSAISDANGSITTNLTFANSSTYSYSGEYFMLVNVSYSDGDVLRRDLIPGFFKCTNIRSQIRVSPPSSNAFQISPSGCVLVNITNIALTNGSNFSGTMSVPSAFFMNFGGGPGPMRPESLSVTTSNTINVTNGTIGGAITVCPANFSVSTWGPGQGFLEIRPRLCTAGNVLCENMKAGIPLGSSFEAYMPFGPDARRYPGEDFNQPSSVYLGSNATFRIISLANLSNLTAKLQRNGPFPPTPISSSYTNVSTGVSFDGRPYILYEVNVTIPGSASKGQAGVVFDLTKNITNEKASVISGVTLVNLMVYTPLYSGQVLRGSGSFMMPPASNLNQFLSNGWNMTFVNETLFGGNLNLSRVACFTNNTWCSPSQSFDCVIQSDYGAQAAEAGYFGGLAFMVLDSNSDGSHDTLLLRNKTMYDSMNNVSAYAIVNTTNRSLGMNYTLVDIYDCAFFKATYSGVLSQSSPFANYKNFGEYAINMNITLPFLFKQGTTGANGSTANITLVYRRGIGSAEFGAPVAASVYNTVPVVTDANGLALIRLNFTQSGSYTLYWRLNGSFNDSSQPSSMQGGPSNDPSLSIRAYKLTAIPLGTATSSLREITSDMNVTLSNTTTGLSDYFVVQNAQFFYFNFGNHTVNMTYNTTSGAIRITYLSSMGGSSPANATCEDAGESCILSSTFFINNVVDGPQEFRLRVVGNSSVDTNSTNMRFAFYSPGGNAQVTTTNSTLLVNMLVCAQTFNFPPQKIAGANITGAFAQNFPPPPASPSTTAIAMYDAYNSSAISSVLTGPGGCSLVKIGPSGLSGNIWPDTSFSPPTNTYFAANYSGSVEDTSGQPMRVRRN